MNLDKLNEFPDQNDKVKLTLKDCSRAVDVKRLYRLLPSLNKIFYDLWLNL